MRRFDTSALNKMFLLPGGLLLLGSVLVVEGGFVALSSPVLEFAYFVVFLSGLLLTWRSQSSRTLYALLVLLLAHRALEFFSSGRGTASPPGSVALTILAVLLPLNFLYLSLARERGVAPAAMVPYFGLLLGQSIVVALACRAGAKAAPVLFRWNLVNPGRLKWAHLPQPALLAFVVLFAVLLVRFARFRRPVEAGYFWAAAAVFRSLQLGGTGKPPEAYYATGGFILISAIIETFYSMAYNDELTGLPGRRAFNQAVMMLEHPYSIAVVDIDHFKSVNDTYGHDAGDQVLRMVASKLAGITGGGKSYRIGGEEFTILFRGKRLKEILDHLETLRTTLEASSFRLRGDERRSEIRGPDRRKPGKRGAGAAPERRKGADTLAVTVSIGAAEAPVRHHGVDAVIQAADKALYRAKEKGRNRVETGIVRSSRSA